jgi:hypothetical protein
MSDEKNASISRRNGIAWSSNPMTEPTSVLVLGVPSGLFVDVRLTLKHLLSEIPSDPNTLPPKRSQPYPFQPGTDFEALEFGNAGQATYSTAAQEVESPESAQKQGKWTHWCSSEMPDVDYDTGELTVRTDGSVLETGAMAHPVTKQVTPYSEIWIDEKPVFAPQEPGAKSRTKGTYALVHCEDTSRGIRGMIVWVGRYCQGIVRKGEDVCVERWEFDEKAHGGRGEWVRTWRNGEGLPLPCGWVVKEEEPIKTGSVLHIPDWDRKGGEWHVVETDFE